MGRRVWVPVVSGPLAPYAAEFESWLRSRSYSSSGAADSCMNRPGVVGDFWPWKQGGSYANGSWSWKVDEQALFG